LFSKKITSLMQVARELGAVATIMLGMHRVVSRLGQRSGVFFYRLYRIELQQHLRSRPGSSMQGIWMNSFDSRLLALPRSESKLHARFEQGASCLAMFREGALVGCVWFATSGYMEDEVDCRFRVPPNAVWDFDVFIMPQFRGGMSFHRLWCEFSQKLDSKGYDVAYSRISAFNPGSISSHERLGAQCIGKVVFFRLWRLQVAFSNISPFFYPSIGGIRVPEYGFDG